jgi:hypothetical protein
MSSANKPETSLYLFVLIDQYRTSRSSLLRTPRKHSTRPKTELYIMDVLEFSACKSFTNSVELSSSWECNTLSAVRKFPAFYGDRNFITIFTKARYFSLS